MKTCLFEYVKDHLEHFGFFPCEYENIETGKILLYPKYMKLLNNKQIKIIDKILKEK